MISSVQNAAAPALTGPVSPPGQNAPIAALQILLAAATLAQNLSTTIGKGVSLNTNV